jgi:hypothetical protein
MSKTLEYFALYSCSELLGANVAKRFATLMKETCTLRLTCADSVTRLKQNALLMTGHTGAGEKKLGCVTTLDDGALWSTANRKVASLPSARETQASRPGCMLRNDES